MKNQNSEHPVIEARNPTMDDLEQRIRNAKLTEPMLPEGFSARMWEEIEAQGLTIRPRWRVRVALWLRRASAALLLLGGIWAANTALYELQANGSMELLYFGLDFLTDFVARLPFDLIFAVAALGALGAWLLREGKLARVRMAWVVLITYGLTGAGGLAAANSGLNELLIPPGEEAPADENLVLGYFRGRMHYRHPHPNVRMGRVLKTEAGFLVLETPMGEQLRIPIPRESAYTPGTYLRLRGRATDEGFIPNTIQRCNPKFTKRYFHHMGRMGGSMGDMGGMGGSMGEMHREGGGMRRGGMTPGQGPKGGPMGMGMGQGRMNRGPMSR